MTTRPSRRRFLAAGASLFAAGCTRSRGTRLTASTGDLLCYAAAGQVTALNAATGRRVWTRQDLVADTTTPVVADGLCYLISRTNELFALDAATGATRWRSPGQPASSGGPSVFATGLFCFGADRLRALDPATGEERWTRTIPGTADTLASAGDSVAAGVGGWSDTAWFTAFDARSGDTAYHAAGHGFLDSVEAPICTVDGSYFLGDRGSAYLLNPSSWRQTACPATANALGAAPGILYTASADGPVQAIGTATGRPRWTLPEPDSTYVLAALTSGSRILLVSTFSVTAADAASGRVLWTRTFNQDQTNVGFAAADQRTLFLQVSCSDSAEPINGRVIALDSATGAHRWVTSVEGEPFRPVSASGTLFFSTGQQDVYAVDMASGRIRWISPVGSQSSDLAVAGSG